MNPHGSEVIAGREIDGGVFGACVAAGVRVRGRFALDLHSAGQHRTSVRQTGYRAYRFHTGPGPDLFQ